MGIAAVQRGDALIRRQFANDLKAQQDAEDRQRCIALEIAADEWRREAWAFVVDAINDGGGFARTAIQATAQANGRVFRARHAEVLAAHRAWLDVNPHDAMVRLAAASTWAKAVFRLLKWCVGSWKCELLDRAPRHCRV